jgi:hypothetical protein
LLGQLVDIGVSKAPDLFKDKFKARIIQRFIFSAIRASPENKLSLFNTLLPRKIGIKLNYFDNKLPIQLCWIRIFFAFIVLRPFDILPSIFNRFIGARLISFFYSYKINTSLNKFI